MHMFSPIKKGKSERQAGREEGMRRGREGGREEILVGCSYFLHKHQVSIPKAFRNNVITKQGSGKRDLEREGACPVKRRGGEDALSSQQLPWRSGSVARP